ncbi:hypothetical protein DES53_12033 [Roseimicrobium gellanilyticum]|uniref:Uncharacterized protein n=1 Tax=Roseimicrobium gellanilyticum TaxID=748857 RepID=A0A366H3L5_9BACT|nr:hypothetical protein DES53_12033 [Roseimicrobium gellanilyticum]
MSDSMDALLATLAVASLAGVAIWNTRSRRPAWLTKVYLAVLLAFGVLGYNANRSDRQKERERVERLQELREGLKSLSEQRRLR